jgi:hypothetical protein
MASTSGFQSGAEGVARRHNVTLIHISESANVDPSIFGARFEGVTPICHIQRIEFEYCDGEKKRLPEEADVLTYYVQQIRIQSGSEQQSLEEVIQPHTSHFLKCGTGGYQDHVISCMSGARVVGPDDGEVPLKSLARVHIRAGLTEAQILNGPRMFEPNLLTRDVTVRNIVTGEEKTFNPYDLKLGFNTTFAEGKFYQQPPNTMYFYCDEIKGNVARLYLVESFQLGGLFQAEIEVETQHANFYIPVSDEAIIRRLRRRLERLKAGQQK